MEDVNKHILLPITDQTIYVETIKFITINDKVYALKEPTAMLRCGAKYQPR